LIRKSKPTKKLLLLQNFSEMVLVASPQSDRANRVASAVQGICGNLQKMPSSDSSDSSKVFQSKPLRYQ